MLSNAAERSSLQYIYLASYSLVVLSNEFFAIVNFFHGISWCICNCFGAYVYVYVLFVLFLSVNATILNVLPF